MGLSMIFLSFVTKAAKKQTEQGAGFVIEDARSPPAKGISVFDTTWLRKLSQGTLVFHVTDCARTCAVWEVWLRQQLSERK